MTAVMSRPLRYLSLFSGIGGFDLGFDRAGMECAGQVEYDEKARAVLARHWPDVKRMNDVREVQGNEFGTIDVITGGFPCQDVSVAGRRAGLAGERSGLWFEFHRIIDRVKPGWVVIENVPGLLSSHGGRDFAVILRGLVECGYGVAWRILDAQYFGVPQRRRRVFIVGSLGDGRAAEVLFERESGGGDIAEGRSAGAGFTPVVGTLSANGGGTSRPAGQGNELDFCIPYIMAHGQANAEIVKDGSPSLTLNHEAPIVTATLNSGGNNGGFRTEPGEHLVMAFQPRYYTRDNKTGGQPREIADITNAHKAGDSAPHVVTSGVRRLTPVECERLQGFPDGHTAGQPDSARYRQMGNAVAVPVAEWIGRRIVAVEAMEANP